MTPTSLHPPLGGDWLALNPPGHPPHAHDLVGFERQTGRIASRGFAGFLLGLLRSEDVFGWSSPVLAPLDGLVVASHDGERDRHRLLPLLDAPASFLRPLFHRERLGKVAGNHVLLSTAARFILLAHLREGSLTVGNGDEVGSGQLLGLVGNSGNSMGPHLHIQVMDAPDPYSGKVTPFYLDEFHALEGQTWTHHRDAMLPNRATRVRFAP